MYSTFHVLETPRRMLEVYNQGIYDIRYIAFVTPMSFESLSNSIIYIKKRFVPIETNLDQQYLVRVCLQHSDDFLSKISATYISWDDASARIEYEASGRHTDYRRNLNTLPPIYYGVNY